MGASESSSCCQEWRENDLRLALCMPADDKKPEITKAKLVRRSKIQEKSDTVPKEMLGSKDTPETEGINSTSPRRSIDNGSIPRQGVNFLKTMKEKKNSLSPATSSDNITLPVWMQDPPPMTGWTSHDQRFVLTEFEERPHARKSLDSRQNSFARIHRAIPHKSMEDIEECFEYVERKRIAFFGSKSTKAIENDPILFNTKRS